ncbi:MAG: hypothetical protein HZB33_10400 [Nitrospirae bacterium]|nr:hypothetical protein [Nitrospirota bacterium]
MPGAGPNLAFAEEIDCLMCHEQLAKEKVVHAAVQMGCPGCHSAVDASDVPHKMKNKISKGLSSDQPEICMGCHDKAKFAKKNVHAAVSMGCTGCHNPHSSKNAKLLLSEQPDLCYKCHDKAKFQNTTVHAAVSMGCTGCHDPHSSDAPKLLLSDVPDLCYKCHDKSVFEKKNAHAPVAGGMCLTCHNPHATEEVALLNKRPAMLCLECHPAIAKGKHVTAEKSHPIGSIEKTSGPTDKPRKKRAVRTVQDPMRKGREFYCGSCHDPHGSDFKSLFRYKANTLYELCIYCHKK